jgi:hypothetical protein
MFTSEIVRHLTCNPIAERQIDRVVAAMNGLMCEFGQTWVEQHLFSFDLAKLRRESEMHVDKLPRQMASFDELAFLWDDLEILRSFEGFDLLQAKLNRGLRFDNVDLEISVAADFFRLTAAVELEPPVGNRRKTDLRFKSSPQNDWTYVEVTRKTAGIVGKLIKERGELLASLVAERDPSRRNFIAVTRPMDPSFSDQEFKELLAWIPRSAPNSRFKGYAFVGAVPHDQDETSQVLPRLSVPVSCIQKGNLETMSFGVAYLHVPDLGAESKIEEKVHQTMERDESILMIDLTATHGTRAEWDDRIETMDVAKRFSAVVLLRNEQERKGFTRNCKIVEPIEASLKLTDETRLVLNRFADLRLHQSLT